MALTLFLQTENDQVTAAVNDVLIGGPTPLADLPSLEQLQISPLNLGEKLFTALGGAALLQLLLSDADRTLLLNIPATDAADAVPWEFAAHDRQLLGTRFGLLRLLPQAPPVLPAASAPLHFVALAADPLVDKEGQPTNGYRLNLKYELAEIQEVLQSSGKAILARRLPPTQESLVNALKQGPAWLHLSCHGTLINGTNGPTAILLLEDEHGAAEHFPGRELSNLAAPGVLRLVVLSACQTSAGEEARLAKTLVLDGLPAALGMQGSFADPLSDEMAKALYTSLLAGQSLGQAVRQMRFALHRSPQMAGLPVVYVAPGGEQPLMLPAGDARIAPLDHTGQARLVPEVQAPHPLLGRDHELHQLAQLFKPGERRVVTIAGTGGMGKTALAAAFARRFAWRWPRGVFALSFASGQPDASRFRADVLRGLGLDPADAPEPGQQAAAILDALGQWRGLLLIDNYETILQGVAENEPEALAIHGLLGQAANGGVDMLLTSREQPAGFRHEVLFPGGGSLSGIALDPAARLFLEHSTRAEAKNEKHRTLALAIAQATEGHPLSITLLAGEFDLSQEVDPEQFLEHWPEELAAARRPGPLPHHITLAAAFNRSYERLGDDSQQKLRLLSIFSFPFFAEAAAFLWNMVGEEDAPDDDAARPLLSRLSRGSLLEIDAYFQGGEIPATFRFQPALREELSRRVQPSEKPGQQTAFATYGAWLARRGYAEMFKDITLAQLMRVSMESLEAATTLLTGADRLWHVRRLVWIKSAYGENYNTAYDDTLDAFTYLRQLLPEGKPPPNPLGDEDIARVDSSLRYELARQYFTRGNLDKALGLFQESLACSEKIGDIQGKAATLHQIAKIYSIRGNTDHALKLYMDSVEAYEHIGDIYGKATTLHEIANELLDRGDLDRAFQLYTDSLQLREQIGDIMGSTAPLGGITSLYNPPNDKHHIHFPDSPYPSKKFNDTKNKLTANFDHYLNRFDETLQQSKVSLLVEDDIDNIQGKATTISQMAYVLVARGSFDRALQLYNDSLQLKEQIGDIQGKAATLSQMAYIFRTRGDLDRAFQLYTDSLQLKEQIGDIKGKAATLHEMAYVFVSRGDLDRALQLYTDSLQVTEQIGDIQGKAATLHQMAQVFLTRGDLDKALNLYQESLASSEKIGDIQGKAATLHEMAYVYRTRGDLDRALQLYTDSLQVTEQIGDIQGKAATLSQMAYVFVTRGDLDRALQLYTDSLQVHEQIGDIQGKAATLSQLSDLYMMQNEVEKAEVLLLEALSISQKLQEPSGIAFRTVKLGQIAARRGQIDLARERYRQGLAIFGQLGARREIAQVQQMLEELENNGQAQPEPSPLSQWVQEARQAAQAGNFTLAVAAQEQAIALLRQAEPTQENLVTLSILLFNLSGYLQNSGQFAAAVTALEEVVALDEQTNHPDLASDKAALAQARELAANPPAQAAPAAPTLPTFADILAMFEAQLPQLPAEQQPQLKAEMARLRQLSPQEQAQYVEAMLAASAQTQLDAHANQARDAAMAARRGDIDPAELAQKLEENAADLAQGEPANSPWLALAQFMQAAAACCGSSPSPLYPTPTWPTWPPSWKLTATHKIDKGDKADV